MTHLSSENVTAEGYAIREFPRGPLMGRVKTIGYRQWQATCTICYLRFNADRRVAASKLLDSHYRSTHARMV